MAITLEQPVTLVHVNVRKEGREEEKHLMVDIKLNVQTSSDILLEFDPALRSMLFRDGEARFPNMAPIKWKGDMRHMELELAGLSFLNVKLHKFVIKPFCINGQEFADLDFLATFAPDGRETAIVAEQVGEEIAIKLTPGRELDLIQDDGSVAGAVRKLRDHLVEDGASLTISGPDGKSVTLNGQDALYQQAVEVVRSSGRASITHMQRALKIGYNRAARLIEDMEKAGVVTPMDAAGKRDLVGAA